MSMVWGEHLGHHAAAIVFLVRLRYYEGAMLQSTRCSVRLASSLACGLWRESRVPDPEEVLYVYRGMGNPFPSLTATCTVDWDVYESRTESSLAEMLFLQCNATMTTDLFLPTSRSRPVRSGLFARIWLGR